jgi:hypothetical protein
VTLHKKGSWCRKCRKVGSPSAEGDLLSLSKRSLDTYRRYDESKGWPATDLTLDDVMLAKSSICYYCDRKATGFDRIDNASGHTKINCVPACIRCNWTRGNYLSHSVMIQVGALLKEIDP